MRLAIIGGGSSGLVSLKTARDLLPNWEATLFERSGSLVGVWGDPYPGFVSTSTKYTTQFACFPQWGAIPDPDGGASQSEFFRGDEYGRYLTAFADRFGLRDHARLHADVTDLRRTGDRWTLTIREGDRVADEAFDAVIVATGLAAQSQPIVVDGPARTVDGRALLTAASPPICGQTVVVIGGGEFAVDLAHRLAAPKLGNRTLLSLRSGVRVSPRYHPIRGVPSDFLRNRLMLSFDPGLRNAIGERVVQTRIRFAGLVRRLFPGRAKPPAENADAATRRRYWDAQLTAAAKGGVFDVFHNKSDDFLDAVAAGRLEIVGPPTDATHTAFETFDRTGTVDVDPDAIVPAIGFCSRLDELTGGTIRPGDFHLGCVHAEHDDLFLVGFARPIIGSIPPIAEMQARYACSLLAGRCERPADLPDRIAGERADQRERFPALPHDRTYPVEMIPYCDTLARRLNEMPRPRGWRERWRLATAPATTLDYAGFANTQPTQRAMPLPLVALIGSLRPLDWLIKRRNGERPASAD